MNKRPDGTAVLGLIGLAGLVIVGWVVLSAMGRSIGAEPWQVVMVAIGVVGGWVGKSVWTEATQGRTPVSGPSSDLPGATGAETPPIPPTGPSQTVRGLDRTPDRPAGMTTAAEAVAVARVMYDRGDVYRLPPQGFSAPVSIQDLPPYDDGRFTGAGYNGTPGIQHCGVAVARLLYLAGLMPGRDYPDATAMQYAPTLAGYINVDGDPRPGDIAVYDFQPDRVEDHVGLVVDTSGLPATVTVWQCNTTDDGRAYYYDDPTGWIVGYVRPAYSEAAPPLPDGADVETLCARFFRGQGFSDAGVAGALANWHAESKFDPGIVEGGGHDLSAVDDVTVSGIGLAQWSFSRREGLLDFAAARGLAWNDAATQFAWTVAEVQSRADFQALWQRMAAAFDPVEASRDFDSVFEGSGVKGSRFATAATFYEKVVSGAYWGAEPTPQHGSIVPVLIVLGVL